MGLRGPVGWLTRAWAGLRGRIVLHVCGPRQHAYIIQGHLHSALQKGQLFPLCLSRDFSFLQFGDTHRLEKSLVCVAMPRLSQCSLVPRKQDQKRNHVPKSHLRWRRRRSIKRSSARYIHRQCSETASTNRLLVLAEIKKNSRFLIGLLFFFFRSLVRSDPRSLSFFFY